jgi:hypothetical protein
VRPNIKRAALVIVVLFAIAIYGLMSGLATTGSGGLGAVSAGFSETILELVALTPLVLVVSFCWRQWRRIGPQGSSRLTADGRPRGPHRSLRCSFCNRQQQDVKKLIAGPNVFICDSCVEACREIIANDG